MSDVQRVRAEFRQRGQEHVFRFWEDLDPDAQDRLVAQASRIDFAPLDRALSSAGKPPQIDVEAIGPVPVEALLEHGGDPADRETARQRGEDLLRAGRVGVLVVAGGQATRLGVPGPKGLFPLGPVTSRSLFAQQAQKLRHLRDRCGHAVPWLVMTSPATDAPTREAFSSNDYFGLPAEDVFFFCQSSVPSVDFQGRLLLERADRIFESPDGHGGAILALRDSGALDEMERRGIDLLFYYQVDNPLVHLGDPVFIGFHALRGAEMSCKVVRKRSAEENVGVVVQIGDQVGILEYTEIADAQREARDAQGALLYWAGNVAMHVLNTDFLRRVAADAEALLPLHPSRKKIPALDASGTPLSPDAPNGYKLERFIFDALLTARRVCVVEVRREEEYSPVKNAEGPDSPATARRDLEANYRAWLSEAGLPAPPERDSLEIDESRISGPEELRALGVEGLANAGEVLLTSPGAKA
ncbi:MAG: UDPGP type 1 family protein [Myxococcales bacterium]|nr:UDPGP type 1 family protein [Myxococcales bacterium]